MGLLRNGVPLRGPGGGSATAVYVAPPEPPPEGGDEFNVLIVGDPDFTIVATSVSGDPLMAGSFVIPTAGTYTAVIHNLDGAERSITVSSGSVSKDGDTNPFTVDAGDTVGGLTIVATGSNAVVTIS